MIQKFTDEQIEKLTYRLDVLEHMNSNITSVYKFKDVKLFEDSLGNIFLSYISVDQAQKTYDYFYIEYDKLGNETILNKDGRFSQDELKAMFLNFKQLDFKQ
jgi:hypothetical protein